MSKSKRDASVRIELTILLVVMSFAAGIAVGAWMEMDLTERAQRTTDGVTSLVNTVRQQMADDSLPITDGYTDVTEILAQHQLLPPVLMKTEKLQSSWGNPMSVAVNNGSAIPVIEVSVRDMSTRSCKRLITHLTRRYYNVSDLRSIWVGPPGRTLSKFPVTKEHTGCAGSNLKVVLQYQAQAPRR
jgi:type II secretory pathway pseudopilin PulG